MADLKLEQLSKVYRGRRSSEVLAVDRLDLDVAAGEIVGLLGSSGCGKTSTLRMIAGFESVSHGEIVIGARRVKDLPPASRNVAMAFEGYALYPPLRVRDNIVFGLLRDRRPRQEVESRVAEIAGLLEIQALLDRYPPTLSGGEQQRVSLARALVRSAEVYLLDEPMSQLEPQLRALLRGRVKDWLIRHAMTTIFVTHDQTEAIALADRIAVMEAGVLQQYATPADLRDRPANLFVAGFIGEPPMNLLDARVCRAGPRPLFRILDPAGRPAFDLSLQDLHLSEAPLDDGKAVVVGVRPHHLLIGGAEAGLGGTKAEVRSHQWLGDQTHLELRIGGVGLIGVLDDPVGVDFGTVVEIGFRPDSLHIFDGQSGLALTHGSQTVRSGQGAAA